ncbi:hypothetical protein CEXT_88681 [Caerostris extrusa]|uniref:Uncharacterized protein n=1 Tax=Caerostris extrusa TaxID=172846 RepID=A0AAV4XAG1_CAEEX|nr:hypothetical protein CEXT_88681 [Caerostris extrusa]
MAVHLKHIGNERPEHLKFIKFIGAPRKAHVLIFQLDITVHQSFASSGAASFENRDAFRISSAPAHFRIRILSLTSLHFEYNFYKYVYIRLQILPLSVWIRAYVTTFMDGSDVR